MLSGENVLEAEKKDRKREEARQWGRSVKVLTHADPTRSSGM